MITTMQNWVNNVKSEIRLFLSYVGNIIHNNFDLDDCTTCAKINKVSQMSAF